MTALHASLRRDTTPTCDGSTGEVRVPIALFRLDECQGDADLVLPRAEAVALFAHLRSILVPAQPAARPEPVR